ncbi:circadian clock-controlled protein daywake-like [Battus philenor]|uniref:circadian clock-controlled protein daywake-like n=1 Tax=Battus philenor TaxID=42288 RepID=UPI0035CFB32B
MLYKIILFLLLGAVSCAVLPAEKCKLEDSSCMAQAFQKAIPIFMAGMPEYGVEVLDVMELDPLKFELAGLKFSLKDGRVKGLKNSLIKNIKWDLKGKKLNVVFHFDASIKGHYTADGRILILPISGDGQMKLKLKNLEIGLELKYEMEERDGKKHIAPKSYTYKYEVKDGANFDLTNLFNGNKELSDPMLIFLNDNWKQITEEFGGPMIKVSSKKIFDNIVRFFAKNPISEIALL